MFGIDPLDLYVWNVRLAASMFELVGYVEVFVRNAMARELDSWSRAAGHGEWYENQHGYFAATTERVIQDSLLRLEKRGKSRDLQSVTAELNLGFWRNLLSRRYKTTIWPLALQYSFTVEAQDKRAAIASRLERIVQLRNRIAHQEHIVGRNIQRDVEDALFLADAAAPGISEWLVSIVSVDDVLRSDPRRLGS